MAWVLELPWEQIQPVQDPGSLVGLRLGGTPAGVDAYVAVEWDGRRHFLVGIPLGMPDLTDEATRGLRVTTRDWIVGDRPSARYIDLACIDVSLFNTFDAVVREIGASVAKQPADPRAAVVDALRRWRRFWAVESEGLGRDAELGLFGELFFLSRWMPPLTPAKFGAWFGADASRHDFQSPLVSVEVKSTAWSSGPPVHHIQSLDQLADPEEGELHLFSLHVSDDPLASNSLPSVAQHLLAEAELLGPSVLTEFQDRLALVGYSPAHASAYQRTFRILGERLYRVNGEFPRLTRSGFPGGLPSAIPQVSYLLSLDALDAWSVAVRPDDSRALFEGW